MCTFLYENAKYQFRTTRIRVQTDFNNNAYCVQADAFLTDIVACRAH